MWIAVGRFDGGTVAGSCMLNPPNTFIIKSLWQLVFGGATTIFGRPRTSADSWCSHHLMRRD